MYRHAALLAIPLALAAALPAQASTLPDPGLPAGKVALTVGIADAGLEYGLTEQLQIGAGGAGNLIGVGGYGRATWAFLKGSPAGDLGLHVAAGYFQPLLLKGRPGLFVFVGPAIAKTWGWFTLRGTLSVPINNTTDLVDPVTGASTPSWGIGGAVGALPLIPNLELAFKLSGENELTLGGNAIIGWRTRL